MGKIVILTAMGGHHGMGHATRMKALARELSGLGREVFFMTSAPELGAFVEPFHCLEFMVSLDVGDTLVIDQKQPQMGDSDYEKLRDSGIATVRIDHPMATNGTCDLLIMPNAHQGEEKTQALRREFGNKLLIGWDYVIIDQAMACLPRIPYEERSDGPIMFCAGGSDPSRALEKMHEWSCAALPGIEKIFAIGQVYSGRLSSCSMSFANNVRIAKFEREMIRNAALVVGMFGQTVYECIYWGTPMLIMGHTDENIQGSFCLGYGENGTIAMGYVQTMSMARFQSTLSKVHNNARLRHKLSTSSEGRIDGLGASRIANAIVALN